MNVDTPARLKGVIPKNGLSHNGENAVMGIDEDGGRVTGQYERYTDSSFWA